MKMSDNLDTTYAVFRVLVLPAVIGTTLFFGPILAFVFFA